MKIKNVLVDVAENTTLSQLIDELLEIKEDEGNLLVIKHVMIPLADEDSYNFKLKLESE